MKCLKEMKDILVTLAVEQLKHPECVNTEEMKDVIKMIKYLQEAVYYYTVTEAMEDKYQVGDWEEHPATHMEEYMSTSDATKKEKHLEAYLTEIGDEVSKMLAHATPHEKQMMQQKMAHIVSKII